MQTTKELETINDDIWQNAIGDLLKTEKRAVLTLLSKFNALKEAAIEKQVELDECLQEKKDSLNEKARYNMFFFKE